MQRATRLLQPLGKARPCLRASCIPHAGPSNLSRRVLSTTQLSRPVAPFSALRRTQAPTPPPEEIHEGKVRRVLEVIEDGDVEAKNVDGRFASVRDVGDESGREERGEEQTDELEPRPAEEEELWEEEEPVPAVNVKEERKPSMVGRRIDAALLPFVEPVKPRSMIEGEPIILPLSSFESADPTKPVASGVGIALPHELFNETIRRDILHTCVVWWLAFKRRGTHMTISRAETAFSKKKIRPQKGTGKARLGARGSPMLRKGGRAHPKRNRDWSIKVPRKVRAAGFRMALSSKLFMGTLRVVENLNEGQWKSTRQAKRALTRGSRLSSEYWPYPTDDANGKRLRRYEDEEDADYLEESETAEEEVTITIEDKETSSSGHESATKKRHEWSDGFDQEKAGKLSILFLYPPTKPATEIWDFARPLRNIPGVEIMSTDEVETYHLLQYRWVVMEADCVDALSRHAGQIRSQAVSFPEAEVSRDPETVKRLVDRRAMNNVARHVSLTERVSRTVNSDETGIALHAPEVISLKEWRRGHLETARPAKEPTIAPMRRDHVWLMNKWRRHVGKKSLLKTFGHKPAYGFRLKAVRAWKKIRRAGMYATPDRVAMEINAGKEGGRRSVTAVEYHAPKKPGVARRKKLTRERKANVRHILKKDEGR